MYLYDFAVLMFYHAHCSNMFRIVLICSDIFMQHSFEAYPKTLVGLVQWMCIACARYDSSTPRGPPMDIRPRAGLKSVVSMFLVSLISLLWHLSRAAFFGRIWHVDITEDAGFPSIRRSWAAGRMGCADRTRAGQTCAFTDLLIKSYQVASVKKSRIATFNCT